MSMPTHFRFPWTTHFILFFHSLVLILKRNFSFERGVLKLLLYSQSPLYHAAEMPSQTGLGDWDWGPGLHHMTKPDSRALWEWSAGLQASMRTKKRKEKRRKGVCFVQHDLVILSPVLKSSSVAVWCANSVCILVWEYDSCIQQYSPFGFKAFSV